MANQSLSIGDIADFALRPRAEQTPRWVRVKFGGTTVADSRRAMLAIQYGPGRLPAYYFPAEDVSIEALDQPGAELKDGFEYRTLRAGERTAPRAAWIYRDPPPELQALRDMVSFDWNAMDGWYEEEEQVFVHARDPYKRVDVLASSRHVRVVVDGETVAETRRPHLLFETLLPTRYYIPAEDVRTELLVPSHLRTQCPYKGTARYWHVNAGGRRHTNLVWSYGETIPENPKIRDLLCFFNEQVDIYVDGELQQRPITPWSKRDWREDDARRSRSTNTHE